MSRWAVLFATILPLLGCGTVFRRRAEPTPDSPHPYAADLLRADRCTALRIEIDYATGCRPSEAAVAAVLAILRRECRKPNGIEVIVDEEMAEVGPVQAVPREVFDTLVQNHRNKVPVDSGCAYLHVVIVPWFGDPMEGKGSRGFCSPPLIAIAREKLRSYAFLHLTLSKIERLVLVHEVGHALGLVENDLHEYGGHCTNPCCVMYSEPDVLAVLANFVATLFGSLPDDYCSDCRRDLAAMRDGEKR